MTETATTTMQQNINRTLLPLPSSAWAPMVVLVALFAGFVVDFSWLSIQRHNAFQSHAFDLANMDQAVWNTLHGHPLRFTDMKQGQIVLTNRLAIHVEPLLVLLAPLYLLHSGPETLLVVQALVVGTGAIPAYLLALRVLGHPWLSLVFPCAYLLHPSLQNALLDDFHAVVLSAALLLWMLYYMVADNVPGMTLTALLSLLTKEEVGLIVAAAAIVMLARRHRYLAALMAMAGVGWFVVSVALIIPAFNPGGHSPYLGRYAYLGHGIAGIVAGVVHHPERVLHVLGMQSRLNYLNWLLHPLGFVSIIGAPILLLSAPALAINMLSADSRMYSGFYQYSAEIVPFVVAASIWGTRVMSLAAIRLRAGRAPFMPVALCLLVLGAAVVDTRRHGFSQVADGYLVPRASAHQNVESALIRSVPQTEPVAAADEILPHLSDRRWAYLLPTVHPANGPPAEYIVLDASIPSLPVAPRALHAVAARALRSGYGIAAARDGVLVLRRGATAKRLPADFYSFLFSPLTGAQSQTARWGALRLAAVKTFPVSGTVTSARPDVHVQSFWRCLHQIPVGTHIAFYVSPVYQGQHPAFSGAWRKEDDSPAWDWLPIHDWQCSGATRADSLSLFPDLGRSGWADIAIGVSGAGSMNVRSTLRVAGARSLVRIATVQVRP